MSADVMGMCYYNYQNLDQATKECMVKYGFNIAQFRYIYDICNTKVAQFSYGKLPDGLTSEILETSLLFTNHLCFYHSEVFGKWFLCKWIPCGEFNEYYKPTKVNLISLSGNIDIASEVPWEEIILCRDNRMDIIPFLVIAEYIGKIVKIEDTMDKVMTICSLPVAIVGNKKQATSLKQMATKMGVKDPFIVGDDTMTDSVKSFNITVPVSPNEFYDLRKKYINECRASQGIYSVDEKRERIVTQELLNLNDFSDTVYQAMVDERKEFVRQLNEKGCNVEFNETYERVFQQSVDEARALAEANAVEKNEPKAGDKDE